MAIRNITAKTSIIQAPRWPTEPIDPAVVWVDYDVVADEFLVYFGGKPVPAISDPLEATGLDDVAIMIGLNSGGEETEKIVGVQVIPMLLGAVQEQPRWAVLAWAAMAGDYGTELLQERLPGFLDQVHDAVDRYWTPPPPIEVQLAHFAQPRRQEDVVGPQDTANSE